MKKTLSFLLFLIFIYSSLRSHSQSIEMFGQSDKTFYDNGNLYTETMINQKNNNTKIIVYFEDGKTKLGEMEYKPNGNYIVSKSYWENGKINHEDYYDNNGKLLDTKCWDPYGILIDCKSKNDCARQPITKVHSKP